MQFSQVKGADVSSQRLDLSIHRLPNGRWGVVRDRDEIQVIDVPSRRVAFDMALQMALDHPPARVDLKGAGEDTFSAPPGLRAIA